MTLTTWKQELGSTPIFSQFWILKIILCVQKVISRYVWFLTFCSKINLNFLWSEILLQRYVFFAFFAIFWHKRQLAFWQFNETWIGDFQTLWPSLLRRYPPKRFTSVRPIVRVMECCLYMFLSLFFLVNNGKERYLE